MAVGVTIPAVGGTLISCFDAHYGSLFRGLARRRPGSERACAHVADVTDRVQAVSTRMLPGAIRYVLHPAEEPRVPLASCAGRTLMMACSNEQYASYRGGMLRPFLVTSTCAAHA